MPSVVIQNFCQYCNPPKYPKYGLNALQRIITKSVEDEDAQLQMMLIVHISKMDLSIYESALYYKSFERMTANIENPEQVAIWKEIAHKVLAHSEVSSTVLQ